MSDYVQWLNTHTHKFDKENYCELCGFHKDELLVQSGIYQNTLEEWNDYETHFEE